MRFDRLTLNAQAAFQDAQELAVKLQHQAIDVEHLLKVLLDQTSGTTHTLLEKLDIHPASLIQELDEELKGQPKISGSLTYGSNMTSRLQQVFTNAFREADSMHDEFISTEHLLLAILDDMGTAGKL